LSIIFNFCTIIFKVSSNRICIRNRYFLKERTDDSILLILIIRLMDALGNYGNKNLNLSLFDVYGTAEYSLALHSNINVCRELGV
jgi:hypothetical protein